MPTPMLAQARGNLRSSVYHLPYLDAVLGQFTSSGRPPSPTVGPNTAFASLGLLGGKPDIGPGHRDYVFEELEGKLNESVQLKTDYTGIPVIDYPIAVLVAFFFYGTNGHDEGYNLFLVDAYSTLQSAFVWLFVEAIRPGKKPKWIARPVIFGILWQCFGAAISLPLYYACHLLWVTETEVYRVRNLNKARAIPFSFLIGAIIPALIGMAPTWNGPDSRSVVAHQTILAIWQPDPIWVAWIQMGLQNMTRWLRGQTGPDVRKPTHNSFLWIRGSYVLAAVSSAVGHLYAVGRVLTSNDQNTNFVRMYVPFPFTGPAGVPDILIRGPWLFLQYDLIIIGLSSISWAFILLARTPAGQRPSKPMLVLLMLAGYVTIGPGATVSLALYARERRLHVGSQFTDTK
ncbi:hypothetical protein DL771_004881 [Monosporascus sp. 5C6A]|nr:hypothetical protein DL771_004881 [Monosporascus sp. 5C6A]